MVLLVLPIGCQQHATTQSESPPIATNATANSATGTAKDNAHAVLQLPALPDDTPLIITLGQALRLPTRTPAERWQLDYDPRLWRRSDADSLTLIAIATGETDLVQHERPERGGPAPRRFVYRLQISP